MFRFARNTGKYVTLFHLIRRFSPPSPQGEGFSFLQTETARQIPIMTIGFSKHTDFYDRVPSNTVISVKSHNAHCRARRLDAPFGSRFHDAVPTGGTSSGRALQKLFRSHDSVFGSLARYLPLLIYPDSHNPNLLCCRLKYLLTFAILYVKVIEARFVRRMAYAAIEQKK